RLEAEAPRHRACTRSQQSRIVERAARPAGNSRHGCACSASRCSGGSVKIHDLKPAPGSRRPKRRVGRGIGGKGGKTAGRGSKGQGARGTVSPRFEGGQTPIHRRTPKAKGFTNPFRVEYHVVNLETLELFDAGTEVTPETLRSHGLVAKRGLVKVLGRG